MIKLLIILLVIGTTFGETVTPCGRNKSATDIYIIGFFPCTSSNDTRSIRVDNCDGIDRIPIMKLALEEINERCDLLPGYRLVVDYANSAVSIAVLHSWLCTMDNFHRDVWVVGSSICSGGQ